ncbi:MAG: nicotinate phosphoribosyltransferase [Deltaproteobacteria bacterium]|nr:nicotinate phosphoribosyltransferase [Deltaproteobacteria bacterium]
MYALYTDRYQLSMLGSYLREGLASRRAVFELSMRRLPRNRRFLVMAGIDRGLRYLENLRFTDDEIAYLREAPSLRDVMTDELIAYLRAFRFSGDVYGLREGELLLGGGPVLRVEGTLAEAQLVETFLLGAINHEAKVASKAARVVLAAQGRPVIEFGARRLDPMAAPTAARAAYIAGCVGTSSEEAGFRFGVPVTGTCAHSYMLAHVDDGEVGAFAAFSQSYPSGTSLLIDTWDTLRGAIRATAAGPAVHSVRIDSGDLATLGPKVRAILDAAGRSDIKLIASDDMDEFKIQALLAAGAPYDSFGVGTAIVLSPDAPSFGAVYKLVEVDNRHGKPIPVAKRAPGKASYGGRKQLLRRYNAEGIACEDVIALVDEATEGEPLFVHHMHKGQRVTKHTEAERTKSARALCKSRIAVLSQEQRVIALEESVPVTSAYRVSMTDAVRALERLEDR